MFSVSLSPRSSATPIGKRLWDLGVFCIEVKLEKPVLEPGSLTQKKKRLTCCPVCLPDVPCCQGEGAMLFSS